MTGPQPTFDAVVIGGGFYGCVIAASLARRGLGRVLLAEQDAGLLTRASLNNQARVHNGYHYPRSFTTAYRSRLHLPRFVQDWPAAVRTEFTAIYAVARQNSKVSARQFQRFCREIGAPLEPAPPSLRALFSPRLTEDVFVVQEYVFDATCLAAQASAELAQAGVEVALSTRIGSLRRAESGLWATLETGGGDGPGRREVHSRLVFNCTYSGLNQLGGDFPGTTTGLKHEIAELALLKLPPELVNLGITVMDGPFFSLMPFPSRQLHTLTHVRYTPHLHWADRAAHDPAAKLRDYGRDTRVDRMLRDATRYLPALAGAQYEASLFEVKTVLLKNETDDGRPILFEAHGALPGCYSVLGGKIDNVYDVLDELDHVVA